MVQENFPWCWPILATWPYAVRFFFVFFIKTLPGKCIASRGKKLVRLKYSSLLDLYKFSAVIISYCRFRGRRYAIAAFTLIATAPNQYQLTLAISRIESRYSLADTFYLYTPPDLFSFALPPAQYSTGRWQPYPSTGLISRSSIPRRTACRAFVTPNFLTTLDI